MAITNSANLDIFLQKKSIERIMFFKINVCCYFVIIEDTKSIK